MKIAIVYASETGNTAQIAQAIREGCQGHEIVAFGPLPRDVGEAELIFVGSWTDKGTCAPAVKEFCRDSTGSGWPCSARRVLACLRCILPLSPTGSGRRCRRKIRCWVPGSVRGGCPCRPGPV